MSDISAERRPIEVRLRLLPGGGGRMGVQVLMDPDSVTDLLSAIFEAAGAVDFAERVREAHRRNQQQQQQVES